MPQPKLHADDLLRTETEDSSMTLFHKSLGVHYRSIQGARNESMHVFIKASRILEQREKSVVELGFGAAMNFHCLVENCAGEKIHYIAIDHQPIPPEFLSGQGIAISMAKEALQTCRKSGLACTIEDGLITLELHPCPYEQARIPKGFAKAFFHDPFCPATNPQAWSSECFSFARDCLDDSGVLATYGAAGHSRRAMATAGLYIATAKGPGRKREITLAARRAELLSHAAVITKYPPRKP